MKKSSAKILAKLLEQKQVNGSEFCDKKLLQELLDEKIVHQKQLSFKKKKIILLHKNRLHHFLRSHYKINDLDAYIAIFSKEATRHELIQTSQGSKTKATHVMQGLYLQTLAPLDIDVDAQTKTITPTPNGAVFISYKSKIALDKNILITVVENFENLLLLQRQQHLFAHLKKPILFVFRNSSLYNFLKTVENEVLYFGDIDLAGIAIYQNEIAPKLTGKSSFFIPQNIQSLLQDAPQELYFKQYEKYKNIQSQNKKLAKLINLIHYCKATIEQESLIRLKNEIDINTQ